MRLKMLCSFICALVVTAFGQNRPIVARAVEVTSTQCRKDFYVRNGEVQNMPNIYNVTASIKLVFTNESQKQVLLYKKLEDWGKRVAESKENLLSGKYVTHSEGDFFYEGPPPPRPSLDDFTKLGTGENYSTEIVHPFKADATITKTVSMRLAPGKYWVQLEIGTSPDAFMIDGPSEVKKIKKKWKSAGELITEPIWTEPFEIEVKLDPDAPQCHD